MKEFLAENWQIITGLLGTAVAYIFGGKRRKADDNNAAASALETMQRAYDTFVTDSKAQYDALKSQFADVINKLEVVENREREGLKNRASLEGKLELLNKQLQGYEQTIVELRKQVNDLEAELALYKPKSKKT